MVQRIGIRLITSAVQAAHAECFGLAMYSGWRRTNELALGGAAATNRRSWQEARPGVSARLKLLVVVGLGLFVSVEVSPWQRRPGSTGALKI